MTNLARDHYLKHAAKEAASQANEFGSMQATNVHDQMLLQLKQDQSRLSQIQSTSRKVMFKQEMIENYIPYIDGVLDARPGIQDEVLARILVWTIDISEYSRALQIARYMMNFKLTLPDQFSRTVVTFLTEQISDEFLKEIKNSTDVDISVLQQLEQLTQDESIDADVRDMPEIVKAKLYLALGKASLALVTGETQTDLEHATRAQGYLETALKLDDKCRGRADLNTATKLVEQLKVTPPTSTTVSQTIATATADNTTVVNTPTV